MTSSIRVRMRPIAALVAAAVFAMSTSESAAQTKADLERQYQQVCGQQGASLPLCASLRALIAQVDEDNLRDAPNTSKAPVRDPVAEWQRQQGVSLERQRQIEAAERRRVMEAERTRQGQTPSVPAYTAPAYQPSYTEQQYPSTARQQPDPNRQVVDQQGNLCGSASNSGQRKSGNTTFYDFRVSSSPSCTGNVMFRYHCTGEQGSRFNKGRRLTPGESGVVTCNSVLGATGQIEFDWVPAY